MLFEDKGCTFIAVFGAQANSSFSLLATANQVSSGFRIDQPDSISGEYPFTTAVFGPPLPKKGLTACVVYAQGPTATDPSKKDSGSACEPLANADEVSGCIALLDRGPSDDSCPYPNRYFANKVLVAQQANAVGVIVADNVINDITVYGWDQTVLYKNGAPIVWDRGRELGMTNRINQVPA